MGVTVAVAAFDVLVHRGELEEAERALQAGVGQGDAGGEQQLVVVADEEEEAVLAAQAEAEVELPVDVEVDLTFGLQAQARNAQVQADVATGIEEVLADLHLPPDFGVLDVGHIGQVVEGGDVGQAAIDEQTAAPDGFAGQIHQLVAGSARERAPGFVDRQLGGRVGNDGAFLARACARRNADELALDCGFCI